MFCGKRYNINIISRSGVLLNIINYRLDTTAKFKVDDFRNTHYGSNIKVFDGDVTQLLSINCETE